VDINSTADLNRIETNSKSTLTDKIEGKKHELAIVVEEFAY